MLFDGGAAGECQRKQHSTTCVEGPLNVLMRRGKALLQLKLSAAIGSRRRQRRRENPDSLTIDVHAIPMKTTTSSCGDGPEGRLPSPMSSISARPVFAADGSARRPWSTNRQSAPDMDDRQIEAVLRDVSPGTTVTSVDSPVMIFLIR